MIKIKEEKTIYESKPIDAIIDNNTIIPGKKGKIVDINKSYLKMKKLSFYSPSLYVYKTINPNISLNNNYDKVIIKGNNYDKNISIILKLKDISLLNIVKEYPELNIVIDNNYFNNYKPLNNNLVDIENNNIHLFIDYCYIENQFQNLCSIFKKHTIAPTIITYDYYYLTYKYLEPGKIFLYTISNKKDLEKVFLILSGLKNIGYKVVSLNTLVNE